MERWVWTTRWFLFCFKYSRLHRIYHQKHEKLTTVPPIHVYSNRIFNRLVLKTKDGYKLELRTPEGIGLFGSTKKLIDKTKNGEKIPSLEVAEVVLVQCNLADDPY